MMTEEWRDIPGREGCYQVSDLGHVRSVDRVIVDRSGRGKSLKGRLLRSSRCGSGYQKVALGRGDNSMVHRLVALTFLGRAPWGHEVRHLNGDQGDNRLCNLSYATHAENELDKRYHGTHHLGSKTRCIRDHPLVDPNLVEFQKRRERGYRQCKACYYAVAWRSRRQRCGEIISDEQLKLYADASYQRIVSGKDGRQADMHERATWIRQVITG